MSKFRKRKVSSLASEDELSSRDLKKIKYVTKRLLDGSLTMGEIFENPKLIPDCWYKDSESVKHMEWYKDWNKRQKLYEMTKRDFKTRVLVILTKQITKKDVMNRLKILNQSIYHGPVRCEV